MSVPASVIKIASADVAAMTPSAASNQAVTVPSPGIATLAVCCVW
jgi:hypothetical protein